MLCFLGLDQRMNTTLKTVQWINLAVMSGSLFVICTSTDLRLHKKSSTTPLVSSYNRQDVTQIIHKVS